MAIELGANLLGEAIIFIIAAGVLLSEYNRSARKEAAKEEAKRVEMSEIQNALRELFIRSEEQAAHIRELSRMIGDLDGKIGYKEKSRQPPAPHQNPPPAPQGSAGETPATDSTTQNTLRHPKPFLYNRSNNPSLILRAVSDVEEQFWDYPFVERQSSLLMLGLFYSNSPFRNRLGDPLELTELVLESTELHLDLAIFLLLLLGVGLGVLIFPWLGKSSGSTYFVLELELFRLRHIFVTLFEPLARKPRFLNYPNTLPARKKAKAL
ncbi:hypothetical protein NQ318_005176 [Aromia moschata]|uniref:Uncharacterized protein n=1 Tax=Aromia moschata TaxID=1265417 RepID=A0AAV8XIY4_9CUCU|nr:hypothetical protein NQ318_005176 [Aromia moschata]